MGTKILPRKVHALEGAQVPPLCVIHNLRVDPETILECYTNSLHLSLSPSRLRRTRYDL